MEFCNWIALQARRWKGGDAIALHAVDNIDAANEKKGFFNSPQKKVSEAHRLRVESRIVFRFGKICFRPMWLDINVSD